MKPGDWILRTNVAATAFFVASKEKSGSNTSLPRQNTAGRRLAGSSRSRRLGTEPLCR